MSTIKFELSKKQDATKRSQILVRVSVSRDFRVAGKTKIFVSPKDWDDKNQTIRKSRKTEKVEKQQELERLRTQLHNLESHIEKVLIDEKNFDTMTQKEDRQEWLDFAIESFYDPCVRLVKAKKLTFDEFAKVYVEIRSKEENWEQAKNAHINQKKLWENPAFDKLSAVQTQLHNMKPKLLMEEITGETIDEYQEFLVKNGFLNSTIQNHITYFRQILKWANERGYLKNGMSVINHKCKKLKLSDPKAINYLTWDEFLQFYNYEFDELQKDLELARDRFCFCCATSLRHSDLEVLRKSCFDNPDDPTSFTFVSKKTDDNLTIYLNEWSKSIYMKYKDLPSKDGLLFPKKSNQKMNKCLKKIATLLDITRQISLTQYCGKNRIDKNYHINEIIATHTGRRTFVVHCLDMGWDPHQIMSYTGHDDYETMKPYMAIMDKKRKTLMTENF